MPLSKSPLVNTNTAVRHSYYQRLWLSCLYSAAKVSARWQVLELSCQTSYVLSASVLVRTLNLWFWHFLKKNTVSLLRDCSVQLLSPVPNHPPSYAKQYYLTQNKWPPGGNPMCLQPVPFIGLQERISKDESNWYSQDIYVLCPWNLSSISVMYLIYSLCTWQVLFLSFSSFVNEKT